MAVRNSLGNQTVSNEIVCRRIDFAECEENPTTSLTADPTALVLWYKKASDVLDFGVDFEEWLKENGECQLDNVTLVRSASNPPDPTPGSTLTVDSISITPTKEAIFMISGGAAGDTVYFDMRVTTNAVQVNGADGVGLPARTLVRRVYFLVTN